MRFTDSLGYAWQKNNSLLCVGFDPDPARFPAHLQGLPDRIFRFCAEIAAATADLVCAFKPQIAYFAAHRAEDELEALILHLHQAYPGIPVILDAKRGDIGATAEQYAKEAFERYQADAVTLGPYMGTDTIAPYLAYPGKGVILLCRTSNPGGGDFQELEMKDGEKLFEKVARLAVTKWNSTGQCALVVGATYPKELARVRELVGDMPLLVPGIGAQGGDIAATVCAGQTANGTGLMLSVSRAILYAGSDEDYAKAARNAAQDMRDQMNQHRPAKAACAHMGKS